MITQRAAVGTLRARVGTDEQARILLRAGVCGTGVPSGAHRGAALLYDEDRVLDVLSRPVVGEGDLPGICARGLYVGRLPRTIALDVERPWCEVSARVRAVPEMGWLTSGLLGARISAYGGLPWIATLCGFVVHGATATGFSDPDQGPDEFVLVEPGAWFRRLERCWFPTAAGGRSWRIWDPPIPERSWRASG